MERIIALAACAAIILWGLLPLLKMNRLRKKGLVAPGKISRVTGKRMLRYYYQVVEVVFTTATGMEVKVSYAYSLSLTVGEAVQVLYNPDKPRESVLKEPDGFDEARVYVLVITGVCGVLVTILF